jgi:SAM-dependent methyltransferase
MTNSCPIDLDVERLRAEIANLYTRVASEPDGEFHFHRGPEYAAAFLGYDMADLEALPSECSRSFAGVGNPHLIGRIHAGETVVDVGCGAGMDLLLAARRVGRAGKAVGVDMTARMLLQARSAAAAVGLDQIEIVEGDAASLPLPDASADVVISNGVLNLVPEKEKVFADIVRILRPGGRLHLADIVLDRALSEDIRSNVDLWTSCIAGALPEAELVTVLIGAGLEEAQVVQHFDCFSATSKEKVALEFGVHGVNVFARKPAMTKANSK